MSKPDPSVPMVQTATNEGQASNMLSVIAAAAQNPLVDVGKMQALLDMQRTLIKDQAEVAFNQAYAQIMRIMPRVKKNGIVEYEDKKGGKQKAFSFTKWEDMDAVIRPILLDASFDLSFDTESKDGGGFFIVGTLSHIMGHCRKARFPATIDSSGGKNNLQGAGSSLSYGKRYCTEMLLNLVREGDDDDGERGGAEFIDLEQCKVINGLLSDTQADVPRFLQYMQAAEVENIQKRDYQRAINALMDKKRQMVGAP